MKNKSKYNLKSRLSEVKLDMNDGRRVIINDDALYNFLDNGVEIDREKDIQLFDQGSSIVGKRRFEYGNDVSQGATLKFFSKIEIPSGIEGQEGTVEKVKRNPRSAAFRVILEPRSERAHYLQSNRYNISYSAPDDAKRILTEIRRLCVRIRSRDTEQTSI